jgi:hypothetical protein
VVEFVGIVPSHLAVVMRFMLNGSLQHLLYDKPDGQPSAVSGLPQVYGSLAREVVVVRMALEAALG